MADETEIQEPAIEQGTPEQPSTQEGAEGQASVNHEVARLTRQIAEHRQMNAALLGAIEQMGQKQPEPPTEPKDGGPPRREQFNDDFAFFEAQQQHALKGMESRVSELVDRQIQERRQRMEQEDRDRKLRESYNKGMAKHPDFDSVVQESATTITNPMVAMMSEHDDPEDIYYHLATHKADAARIAGLTPARQAYEIGKIADSLKAKAPETLQPMRPLSGGSAPAPSLYDTTSPTSDKLSDEEWFRRESERVKAKMVR